MPVTKQSPTVIVAGVTTTAISSIAVALLFVAFIDYRREDFSVATSTDDLLALGTCIEAPSHDVIDKQEWTDDDWKCRKGEQKKLAVMLAASVHTLYHTMHTTDSPSSALVHTTNAVLSATMGTTTGYSVNASLAEAALREISNAKLPKECSAIYPGVTAGVVPSPKPTVIACYPEFALVGPDVNVSETHKASLLAHCVIQFSFGTSGSVDGSGLLPVFGDAPGPAYWPWGKPANFSAATPSTKARVYLGIRFQWSVFAYMILMLTLAFCAVDGLVLLVAEGTIEPRADEIRGSSDGTTEGEQEARRRLLLMAATFFTKRARRWAILSVLIMFTGVVLLVYVWIPWDFGHRLGRPECEINADDDQMFRMVPGTRGGWRSDWDATIIEIMCFAWTIIALFLIPIARRVAPVLDQCRTRQKMEDSRRRSTPEANFVSKKSLTTGTQQLWAITGTVVLFTAYTISGSTFTSAWTDAVMGQPVSWTARRVSEYVYTHAVNGIFAMIASGMTIAVIQGKWLIDGLGCSATLAVFVWIFLAMVPFGLLLVTLGIETFSDKSESVDDCKIFDDGFNSDVCLVKWILLLVGTGMMAVVIVYMSVIAFFRRLLDLKSRKQSPSSTTAGIEDAGLLGRPQLKPWHLPIRFQPPH